MIEIALPTNISIEHAVCHQEVTQFMQALGYTADTYVCYGFACAGLPALFLNEEERFNRRLRWMGFILKTANKIAIEQQATVAEATRMVLDVLNTLKDKEPLDIIDREILAEIPAFCESMELHYQPEYYWDWFEKNAAPASQNITRTLPLLMPDKLLALAPDGIAASVPFTGAYTISELTAYFASLAKVLDEHKENIVLLLSSTTHSMLVKYNVAKKVWLQLDICNTPVIEYPSSEKIAEIVNFFFTGEGYKTLFSTQLFGLNIHSVNTISALWKAEPEWQAMHTVTLEKTGFVDWQDSSWLHVAAQNNDVPVISKILDLNPESRQKQNYSGKTPLLSALEDGQCEAARELLLRGGLGEDKIKAVIKVIADRGEPRLFSLMVENSPAFRSALLNQAYAVNSAYETEDIDMLKPLLIHGAKINDALVIDESNSTTAILLKFSKLQGLIDITHLDDLRYKALVRFYEYAYDHDNQALDKGLSLFKELEQLNNSTPHSNPLARHWVTSLYHQFIAEPLNEARVDYLQQKITRDLADFNNPNRFFKRKRTDMELAEQETPELKRCRTLPE